MKLSTVCSTISRMISRLTGASTPSISWIAANTNDPNSVSPAASAGGIKGLESSKLSL
jgi:hypothetical protein